MFWCVVPAVYFHSLFDFDKPVQLVKIFSDTAHQNI